jgi:predicted transcriptional regulator
MGRMLSVRVSDRTRREVARLARASRRTESAVVREAIEEYVARTPALRPY